MFKLRHCLLFFLFAAVTSRAQTATDKQLYWAIVKAEGCFVETAKYENDKSGAEDLAQMQMMSSAASKVEAILRENVRESMPDGVRFVFLARESSVTPTNWEFGDSTCWHFTPEKTRKRKNITTITQTLRARLTSVVLSDAPLGQYYRPFSVRADVTKGTVSLMNQKPKEVINSFNLDSNDVVLKGDGENAALALSATGVERLRGELARSDFDDVRLQFRSKAGELVLGFETPAKASSFLGHEDRFRNEGSGTKVLILDCDKALSRNLGHWPLKIISLDGEI